MDQDQTECERNCLYGGMAVGVGVLLLLRFAAGWGWLLALVLGIAIAVLAVVVLRSLLCSGGSTAAPRSTSPAAAPPTEPTEAPAAGAAAAAPEPAPVPAPEPEREADVTDEPPAPAPTPTPEEPPAPATPVAVSSAGSDDAATQPEGLSAARDGGPDDLKKIKGVGPKLEDLLHTLGIYHFDQIAAWGPAEVAWMDDNLKGFKGRVTRDDWVAQAGLLAAGGETDYSRKVDDGDVY